MKKLFVFLTVAGMLTFGAASSLSAQDKTEGTQIEATQNDSVADASKTDSNVETDANLPTDNTASAEGEEKSFHYILKEKFIEGGAEFMATILLCLIIGLGLCIERIIYLNMSTTNTKKLLDKMEEALNTGGIDAAKEVCRNTRGPVASIFYQGLDRHNEGLEMVEKSIVSYGGVMMGRLESNLTWISLFIALAPMLGFMGTVIGMIGAFDDIAAAGDISPTVVAGGIKVALLTTVFGLIVAIILQIFYNYITAKIDSLVNAMEDATISFMDILMKFKK